MSSKSSRIFLMNGAERRDLLVVQAARGLVEEEQARLRDERASELDALLNAVRQRRGKSARSRSPTTSSTSSASLLPHLPPAAVRADEHVLEDGHRPEELDVLERPRDPLADDLVGRRLEDRGAVEQHLAGVRLVEPRDDVERRRLAGAVRPDQPRDVPFLDVERDAVESDDSAEAQGDVPYLEEGHPQETLNGPGAAVARKRRVSRRDGELAAPSRTDQSCTSDPAGARTLHREHAARVRSSACRRASSSVVRAGSDPVRLPARAGADLPHRPDEAAAPRRPHEREAECRVRRLLHAVGGGEAALPALVGAVVADEEEDQHVDERASSTRRDALATWRPASSARRRGRCPAGSSGSRTR